MRKVLKAKFGRDRLIRKMSKLLDFILHVINVYEHNLIFLSLLGILFHFISQEVDDAIQYLADLDRVYSEHVRPRFGKRGLEEVRQVGEKRSSAAFIESFLQEDKILREYARNIQNMVRRIH